MPEPKQERINHIEVLNDVEKEHVDQLVALAQDDLKWKAIRWFAESMSRRMAAVQLDLPVHTDEGQASYYAARGRRSGIWDMVTAVEAELAERQRRIDESFTDLTT